MKKADNRLQTPPDAANTAMAETTSKTVKPKPGLVLKCDGGTVQMNEDLVLQAFGTDDDGFIKGAFGQLSHLAVKDGAIDREKLDFIAGALVGIQPTNTLEAMLAEQIVANHMMTMRLASRMHYATSDEAIEVLEKMFTKLARTFPAQLEALHRMRHGGQQKVIVEHVNVADGGQAVFGNINKGMGG